MPLNERLQSIRDGGQPAGGFTAERAAPQESWNARLFIPVLGSWGKAASSLVGCASAAYNASSVGKEGAHLRLPSILAGIGADGRKDKPCFHEACLDGGPRPNRLILIAARAAQEERTAP